MNRKVIFGAGLLAITGIAAGWLLFRGGAAPEERGSGNGQPNPAGANLVSSRQYPRNRLTTGKSIAALKYTPDGRFLTVIHTDRSEVQWDVEACRVISSSPGQAGLENPLLPQPLVRVGQNPDGTATLTLADKKEISFRPIRGFGGIAASACSPDGRVLVLGSEKGDVRFFDITTGRPAGEIQAGLGPEGETAPVGVLASDDGKYVLTTLANGNQVLFDAPSGEWLFIGGGMVFEAGRRPLWVNLAGAHDPVNRFTSPGGVFDPVIHGKWQTRPGGRPEGEAIEKARIRTLTIPTHIRVDKIEYPAFRRTVVSPDARLLAGLKDDNTREIWDLRTSGRRAILPSKVRLEGEIQQPDLVPFCVFSPDGSLLATQEEVNTVAVWEVPAGKRVGELAGRVRDLTFNRVGRGLVLGGKYWDLGTMKPLFDVREAWATAFSSDGGTVAVVSLKSVDIHEVSSGRKLGEFPPPKCDPRVCIPALALNRNGTRIAIADQPANQIEIWDVKPKTKRGTLIGHQSIIQTLGKDWPVHVIGIGFTDGDRVLYSGTSDGAVLLWDVGER